ncbi:class I SAM-dependent methyltransferase [Acuticoccus sediminis]|uniref:class I SAM-dependent methyltransferase n=1 Tax=Acuticoccus sediminis TaxID=2184697 RepID=UPI001B3B519C|nr:class I SAM-dependent methyltransferase [Acuticoccus sediminis]
MESIPVQSCILVPTEEEALNFPRGDITLSFCSSCGFIFNSVFDVDNVDYAAATEESQHFSGTFNRFAERLISDIAHRYDLSGRTTLEIGCGKGDFLKALVATTGTYGIGVDPGFIPERLATNGSNNIKFMREYFKSDRIEFDPDFVVCRHTLEHIPAVWDFVSDIDRTLKNQPRAVFFETPDTRRLLVQGAFWDIYYEHCSYFTLGSHARLFRRAGMNVTDLYLEYGGQYIVQYAMSHATGPQLRQECDLDEVRHLVREFPKRVADSRDYWTKFVRDRAAVGKRVVLWGGGSKATSFITSNRLEDDIADVVDINPFKQGKFIPGTARQVHAPEALCDRPPDTVIAMNAMYAKEIADHLAQLGMKPELVALP